jgi:hypothetical protein
MRPDNVQIVAGVSPADRGVALPQREVDVDVHADFGDLRGAPPGFSVWTYAIRRRVAR